MTPVTDRGLVVLIGAGPGPAGLLTAEGAKWISRADVIIYDRLAGPSMLGMARPDARRIYVGKTPGLPEHDQDSINRLLVEHGQTGKLVVRLKGGDPFIFGRGGEEADVLRQAGIAFRVVPGVTSAIAAGAYAGIPLTDRRLASSMALVTGHQDPAKEADTINWQALAGVDTVVFYMGVKNLPLIAERLMAAGRAGDTPAAIVAKAATPQQRTLVTTLDKLAETARQERIAPPALTIVGSVVNLRPRLNWFEQLPLFGQTVLVTRPAHQAAELTERLSELGAAVIEAPVIEIQPPADQAAMDDALRRLGEYDLVVFTSVNGVESFIHRCRQLGLDGRALGRAKVATIGPATAEALRRNFINPDIQPRTFTSEALGAAIQAAGDLRGKRTLLGRADIATAAMREVLLAAGAVIDEVTFYRTAAASALPEEAIEALAEGRVTWVSFTSSSSVANLLVLLKAAQTKLNGAEPVSLLQGMKLAAIGPVTAETMKQAGLTPTVVAAEHTIEGLVEAIAARP